MRLIVVNSINGPSAEIPLENIKVEIIDGATPCLLQAEKSDGYLYVIVPIKQ